MQDMTKEEFNKLKEESAKKMREIYKESSTPTFPDFVVVNNKREKITENYKNEPQKKQVSANRSSPVFNPSSMLKFINFPELTKNPDSLLILGLIFLLLSDNADEKLILALLFIML